MWRDILSALKSEAIAIPSRDSESPTWGGQPKLTMWVARTSERNKEIIIIKGLEPSEN